MKQGFCVLILLFLSVETLYSQNLVINGDFEQGNKHIKVEFVQNEKWPVELYVATNWYFVTKYTPRYISRFRDLEILNVYQNTLHGDAYQAVHISKINPGLLGGRLSEPLKAGKKYKFEALCNMYKKENQEALKLSVEITDKKYDSTTNYYTTFYKMIPSLTINSPTGKPDKYGWQLYSKTFVAKGGEKFIIFGPFFLFDPKCKNLEGTLLIDNVCICEIDTVINDCSCTPAPYFAPGQTITLNNLEFENNKSVIKDISYSELNKVATYLNTNKTVKIEISGHTDNVGTEKHNLELSTARAKAVADYLISKGIAVKRITYIGYGNTRPVADNTTPEGRAKNRRVEFVILEK